MGYEFATEIQSRAIPALMKNQDLIGLAGTGTGKTAAFAIPTIEKLNAESKEVQALILCPTRELAVQVAEQFTLLMKHHKGLSCLAIYGGQSMYTQLKALQRKPQVIIGTPGRVMDHMRRGTLKLRNLKFLILDEADMGFEEAIETILEDTPAERQTVLFSATMQQEILKITQKYQRNALHIDVTSGKEQSPQIEQSYYEIKSASKVQALKRLLAFHKIKSALVFTNTKRGADHLCEKLRKDGFAAAALHGDLRQSKRDTVMKGFRQDEVRLLIATDVAARGIDVENVDAVFNYDLPRDDQDYTHRIGRTGRAGKTGLAFSFIVGSERQHIERIARRNDNKI
jgi:ATP-dependent RNA helicase DeaD